ncbi:MAG: glutaredoxin family protein [Clostridia bacterium]|jgi:glutaredoxin|nr:glutaredoxin family protein [Clostridia bacterium]
MNFQKVEGKDKGKILLYGLSTCVWCKKAFKLLNEHGVAYEYLLVDELEETERSEAIEELKKWNPQYYFPMLIIGDNRYITGFDKEKILEVIS